MRTGSATSASALILAGALWASNITAAEWYRGNTHTHTVICGHADSKPEVVAQWYLDRGYNFLILSEHNHFIDPATVKLPEDRRSDFILIPGVEVTGTKHIHSTAMNVNDVIPWKFTHKDKSAIIQNHVDGTIDAGGESILNHPNFHYAVSAEDMNPVKNLYMYELYNGHPSVNNAGNKDHVSTEAMWDQMLTAGKVIYGVSSDDAHHFQTIAPSKSNPGRGWVMVKAPKLTPEAITEAMRKGDFYSSSGVFLSRCKVSWGAYRIDVDEERTKEELATLDKLRGHYIAKGEPGWRIEFIGPDGQVLATESGTSAAYRHRNKSAYVRARVTYTRKHPDKEGFEEYFAWGQPALLR